MHFEHNFGLTSNIRDKKNVHGSHFSDTLVLDFLSRPPQTVRNIVLESESSTPRLNIDMYLKYTDRYMTS